MNSSQNRETNNHDKPQYAYFYPISIPPPPGYNLVHCPPEIINKRPPLVTNSKSTNPNDSVFFFYTDNGTRMPLHFRTVRNFFREPLFPWPRPWLDLYMETPSGDILPAHIPSVMDLQRVPEVAKLVLLHLLRKMDSMPDAQIFPDEWVQLLDPEPSIRDYGRIFLLGDKHTYIATGNNTDQFDVFWVAYDMSHIRLRMWSDWVDNPESGNSLMNQVLLGGGEVHDHVKFPMPSCIVVWNVRGVNRLGFKERFKYVVDTHKPLLIALTETRASRKQFQLVHKDLVGGYDWDTTNCGGMRSGFAALWKGSSVEVSFDATASNCGAFVTITAEVTA